VFVSLAIVKISRLMTLSDRC